jgi:hypothetical protein
MRQKLLLKLSIAAVAGAVFWPAPTVFHLNIQSENQFNTTGQPPHEVA